jgi:hypothetical protein
MITTIIVAAVAFVVGGTIGVLFGRHNPSLSNSLETDVTTIKTEILKLTGKTPTTGSK